MEKNTQLPVEVEKEIEDKAEAEFDRLIEKAKCRADNAYAQGFSEGWHEGATAYATKWFICFEESNKMAGDFADSALKMQELQQENAELKRWKKEQIALFDPLYDYGMASKEIRLGESIVTFILNKCREYDKLKQQATGPRWVKASEFKREVGMPYHAKDSRFKGAGHFNDNGAFIWGDCTVTHAKDQDDLYILDEQPAAGREEELKAEIERRTKLLEDDLKRDCRLNMPGISEQEQEATWQAYKKRHNL